MAIQFLIGIPYYSIQKYCSCRELRENLINYYDTDEENKGDLTITTFDKVEDCARKAGRKNIAKIYRKGSRAIQGMTSESRKKLENILDKRAENSLNVAKETMESSKALVKLLKSIGKVQMVNSRYSLRAARRYHRRYKRFMKKVKRARKILKIKERKNKRRIRRHKKRDRRRGKNSYNFERNIPKPSNALRKARKLTRKLRIAKRVSESNLKASDVQKKKCR